MAPTNQGNSTETTLSAFLEKVYPQDTVTDELYNECTALAIARKEDFAGTHYIIDVKTAGQGVSASADYSIANTNRTSSEGKQFLVTESDLFASGGINNKTILKLGTSKNDFKRALEKEMNSCKTAYVRHFAAAFYGEKVGAIGRISAISGGGLVTLETKGDHKYFAPGQTLRASSDPDAGSPDRAASGVVDSVDHTTGKVQLSAAPALWAAGDYLYVSGNFKATPKGFFLWAPQTVTPGESFYGVDRSLARLELAGSYFSDSSGAATDEVIEDAIAQAFDIGADVDTMLMNAIRFNALAKSLKDRSMLNLGKVGSPDRPEIGFKSIQFMGPKGKPVDIMPDAFCPYAKSPLFRRADLTVAYIGKSQGKQLPHYNDFDGLKVRRSREVANVSEWELFAHWCIAFEDPKNLMTVVF